MTVEPKNDVEAVSGDGSGPTDEFLVAGVAGGDDAALGKLLDRYDRLIRFAVFRASTDRSARDPEWVEAIASATWAGFVQSVRRDSYTPIQSVSAYLVRIARNQLASRLRTGAKAPEPLPLDGREETLPDPSDDPSELAAGLEAIESLRDCLSALAADQRTIAGEMTAILDRRWRDAATSLGIPESTLRSRWKGVLDALRRCVEGKTGKSFAPGASGDDS